MGPEVVWIPIGIASVSVSFAKFARRQSAPLPEAMIVLHACDFRAGHRRHDAVTVDHIALALLHDPSVKKLLDIHVDVDAFRKALVAHLDAESATLREGQTHTIQPRARSVIIDARQRRILRRMRPQDLLWSMLLRDEGFSRDWLAQNGVTFEKFPTLERRVTRRRPGRAAAADPPESGHPYRVVEPPRDVVPVILRNDAKTPVTFVVDALVSELGHDEDAACHIAATVHVRGKSVVATMARADAEAAVARVVERARRAGYPLVVDLGGDDQRVAT